MFGMCQKYKHSSQLFDALISFIHMRQNFKMMQLETISESWWYENTITLEELKNYS
jgi:hypothetical protein